MRNQLEHLETMASHPSLEFRIVPYQAGAHAGLAGSFVLFAFPNSSFPDVVAVEHRTGTVYMDTPEETAEYTLIFDSLRSISLNPGDSLNLIARVRQEM